MINEALRKLRKKEPQTSTKYKHGGDGVGPSGIRYSIHGHWAGQITPVIVHPIEARGLSIHLGATGVKRGGKEEQ